MRIRGKDNCFGLEVMTWRMPHGKAAPKAAFYVSVAKRFGLALFSFKREEMTR